MIFVSFASDFDECSLEPNPCDENADCTNSDGSYSCTCKQGFSGDGGAVCEGLRVLAVKSVKSNPLRPHRSQLNAGFHIVLCRTDITFSFLLQRSHCPTIIAFTLYTSVHQESGPMPLSMKNNVNYDMDSELFLIIVYFLSTTPDIDECAADPSPCDENADCTNSDGSYSCTCKQGFTGNGASCEGTA